jgi:hypothetical protein
MHTCFTTLLAAACVAASLSAQATMTPLTSFGTNGWIAPGTHPYVSTGNTERGFSYNPMTGNLVLVARQNVAGISNNVRVLSGTTGADLGGLNNTGVTGGTFPINMVDVAEDGAIYACNLSTSAGSPFRVYKWDDEVSGQTTPPTVAFDSISGVARTGDSFAVYGGISVVPAIFAAAGSNAVSASNFVIGALDGTNTPAPYLSVPGTTPTSNDYRLGLTFVDADTIIGNQGGTARMTSFSGASATVDASIAMGTASRRPLDYAVIAGRPVLATIDTASSTVAVLDLSTPSSPIVLATGNNTVGVLTANGNGTGAVAWGAIAGNSAVLYAMSSNQGIQAFIVTLSPLASTMNYGVGCDGLALTANSTPAFGNSTFELVVSNVPVISPVAFVGFGTTVVNPGLDLTGIGMAGCFAYTSLDLGLYATGPVVGGIASFSLPIPNDPSLASTLFATQGVSLSLLTALNLAASNGTEMVIGF